MVNFFLFELVTDIRKRSDKKERFFSFLKETMKKHHKFMIKWSDFILLFINMDNVLYRF